MTMAAPSTSKIVCLKAFKEELASKMWQSHSSPPPPVPKRIAWPGGKIVSNKDEALARFLRRKLDQGEALTPEQITMLEKMVGQTSGDSTASTKNTRNFRGNGFWGSKGATAEVRRLLQNLEQKVAQRPDADSGDSGSSFNARHAVDLTSLKRSGGKHKRQNPNRRALNAANNISLAKAKAMATKPAAVGAEPGFFSALSSPPATSVVRRVLSNGRGGFCIATGESTTPSTPFGTTITNGAVASLRTTFSVRLVQEQHEGAVSREEPNQQSNNGCSKRSRVTPDVGGSGRASGEMAGDRTSAEDRLGNAAATGTPALYREAGFVNEGREGRGNTVKASARVRGKGGKAGMGGGAIRNAEGGGGVAGVGKRSLEDMMIGGLACSRH